MNSSATVTGCDDIIKRLRGAIAAGPTPGEWTAGGTVVFLSDRGGFDLYNCPSPHINARYIAAASPDNIAALLDRLEAAERENERLHEDAERYRWLRGGSDIPQHSTRWARWEVRHWNGRHWLTLYAEQVDDAIDAARREE